MLSAVISVGAIGFFVVRHWVTVEFPPLDISSSESGQWYSVHPDGALTGDGKPYHANVRVGSENKVVVIFSGGGVSVDDYTEVRPTTSVLSEGFYNVLDGFDQLAKTGVAEDTDGNPFRDWTVVQMPYSTGDFHAGAGANQVAREDGESMTVHHTGYTNLQLVLESVKQITGTPTEILVTGGSAGGFGAAINTDQIVEFFPDTTNITTMVDSSLLLYDWNSASRNVWQSPEQISEILTTDNFTLDALTVLKEQHPSVKILFASSTRDESLARMQSYLNGGEFAVTAQDGEQYQADLTQMVDQLQEKVPGIGLYIFQGKTDKDTGLTQHTIGENTQDKLVANTTPLEWLASAVSGEVTSYGVDLLR
ncbi:pectin acetylesterase-family hydrolase [Pseudoclavibacter terrae]|uniref:pectin acetylesterase-family hydrolase n=1 Tax=Pseudoclavibacter terrae TaxID=1530195 RepID=UPI00232F9DB9|nr:pectin acetylesterase-family hydrolase [Pseudoclavibacter terrae]